MLRGSQGPKRRDKVVSNIVHSAASRLPAPTVILAARFIDCIHKMMLTHLSLSSHPWRRTRLQDDVPSSQKGMSARQRTHRTRLKSTAGPIISIFSSNAMASRSTNPRQYIRLLLCSLNSQILALPHLSTDNEVLLYDRPFWAGLGSDHQDTPNALHHGLSDPSNGAADTNSDRLPARDANARWRAE